MVTFSVIGQTRVGMFSGLTYSKQKSFLTNTDRAIPGFQVGILSTLNLSSGIYSSPSLMFIQKGLKAKDALIDVEETNQSGIGNVSWRTNYIQLSVPLSTNIIKKKKAIVSAGMGPYFGYAFSYNQKYKIKGSYTGGDFRDNILIRPVDNSVSHSELGVVLQSITTINKKVFFSLNIEYGIKRFGKNVAPNLINRSIGLSVGYMLFSNKNKT